LDIEEDIWSPTYGLKGKLDATVLGIISDPVIPPSNSSYKPSPTTIHQRTQTRTPVPLELKTGRASAMEHRAQTMLYTLLLSERYGVDIREGLLYYTQSGGGEVVRVPRGRNEVRGLIGIRNELAGYMWRRVRRKKEKGKEDTNKARTGDLDVDMEDIIPPSSLNPVKSSKNNEPEEEPFLPPPIDDERACKRCYALDTCLLFRKAHSSTVKRKTKQQQECDPPVPAFLVPIYNLKTGHLTSTQTQFFKDWERLLALEEKDLVRSKRELWTLGAKERENKGRCFGGMVLKDVGEVSGTMKAEPVGAGREWEKESKIHRYTYRFRRSKSWIMSGSSLSSGKILASSPSSAQSLLNGHLGIGDAITVSVEPGLLALAKGFILDLAPEEVVVGVDHVLDQDVIGERLGRDKAQNYSASTKKHGEEGVIFRIDKDELFGGMARVRSNLAQLFYADGDKKRLELVVDLRAPVFSPPADVNPSLSQPSPGPTTILNPSQLNAISHVLSAEDYALILGMPGTGKTTVIAELVRMLVSRGKTVLVASYTHSAVDTILMKLSGMGGKDGGQDAEGGEFGILRLGNVDKVRLSFSSQLDYANMLCCFIVAGAS
jgi:DNA replication ATP-dependent helicase Dna2